MLDTTGHYTVTKRGGERVPTRAHDKQSIAALPDPNYHPSTAVMVAQYCPSCSHHEDYRRPCLTQLSSTMPTMSECPTLKYSQPWVNTSQPSSCRLAQHVPSLHHRCRIVRTDPSSCRRVQSFPPPPATCLRALSGRAGEKACAGCRNIGSNFEAEHSLESRRMSRSNNE
ncbi:hypothetical protein EV363DRAFT_1318943 [Boletus edulis]|nr:hypothetical protein EV363DRAFT_1318943 [Boletus edulis]